MSIWGKIIGSAAGLAIGGPLGALLGGLAGHMVDRLGQAPATAPTGKPLAFTAGIVVLGAKLAKSDGQVTKGEIAAFKQAFRVPDDELPAVARLFDLARRDAAGYEPYARQLGTLFRGQPGVLEELLDGLFHVARADGQVTDAELAYLESVAQLFGLDEATWRRAKAANLPSLPDSDPYAILGVDPAVDTAALKARYRALVREHHPDRLTAEGMPPEFVELANEKLAAINGAYDAILKQRQTS